VQIRSVALDGYGPRFHRHVITGLVPVIRI
jgi:hypothetical protein